MTTPEKTVDEIVEEFEKKFHKPVSRDFIEAIKEPHVYADLTEHKNWLTQTLQTERQKREEVVEAIEKEVGGFIAGVYALKFDDNSREAKFWDVWKDGYEQCRKDALNAIKYESRRQN